MGRNRSVGVMAACAALGISPNLGLNLGLGTGLVATAGAQVSSQVNQVEPQHMLVTDQRAMIRCGAGTAYYPVAELRAGTVLLMDGETSSGWARVQYPLTAAAMVKAENAQLSADGKSVTLSREDALVAFNALAGARGSWSKLLSEPLPRGTQLKVIGEAVNDLSGELAGFRVEAPATARGYVRLSFLRAATPSEVESWKSQGQGLAQGEPQNTAPPADPGAAPKTTPTTEIVKAPEQPAEDPGQGESIVEPMVDTNVAANTPTQPVTTPTATPTESATPGEAVAEKQPEGPAPLRISSIEEFEQLFANVQKQTPEEAELGPLLAEVTRMYEATPDSAENASLRTALRQRQSVLKIRLRVQEATRANAALREEAGTREQELVNKVREIEIQRSYAVVGRLLPSAVYDGRRLPRMYRIQSLGTSEAPRTMGYLRPAENLNLENMLGETIGVVGNPVLDPRLNLMIIEPLKIDVIQAGATPNGPAPRPAAEPAAEPAGQG